MTRITSGVAILVILTGVVGGAFAIPFAFSPLMIDVIGAGLSFIAGSILIAGGLNAMTRLEEIRVTQQKSLG